MSEQTEGAEVECPHCLAPAGSPCMRVNTREHEVFSTGIPAKETHLARRRAAVVAARGAEGGGRRGSMSEQLRAFLDGADERAKRPAKTDAPEEIQARLAALIETSEGEGT